MQIIRQVLTALVSSCLIPKILIKYWAVYNGNLVLANRLNYAYFA